MKKKNVMAGLRDRNVIVGGTYGNSSWHDVLTWSLKLETQEVFGGNILDEGSESEADLILMVTQTFNKGSTDPSALSELCGEEIFTLRCFPYGDIEGIESVRTGKRFFLSAWRRKHWPGEYTNALDAARLSYQSRIDALRYSLQDARERMAKLEETYVDWEKI